MIELKRGDMDEAVRWALEDTPAGASTEADLCEAVRLVGPLLQRLSSEVLGRVPWFARIFVGSALSTLLSLLEGWASDLCAEEPEEPEEPEEERPAPSDAAVKLAEAEGVDVAELEGTGKDGRVIKPDVEKAVRGEGEGEGGT